MRYLTDAAVAAQAGRDLHTHGGRLVRMGGDAGFDVDEREARRRAAARGRYGRNALVQGAAAELFKMWALLVRAAGAPIVLCLHDELLVHAPAGQADDVAHLLHDALHEAAARWSPGTAVRFVADVSVVERWSDAH
jgi:DNA polymerase-1